MTVIDSSAIVAIVLEQENWQSTFDRLLRASKPVMSVFSLYETSIVLLKRRGEQSLDRMERLLAALDVSVVNFDRVDVSLAIDAYKRFGKGRHPAQLNFGDCPVYALAKRNDAKLLFVGQDFTQTDVDIA